MTEKKTFEKSTYIKIRISKIQKARWKKYCSENKISMTSLIIRSVENKMMDHERRQVLSFIENQDNIFIKIETNINQIAKVVNTQKYMSESEFDLFNMQLAKIIKLKEIQNEIFLKIYSLIADDS